MYVSGERPESRHYERLSVVCVIAALLEGADANVSAAHNPPFVLFELNEDL